MSILEQRWDCLWDRTQIPTIYFLLTINNTTTTPSHLSATTKGTILVPLSLNLCNSQSDGEPELDAEQIVPHRLEMGTVLGI